MSIYLSLSLYIYIYIYIYIYVTWSPGPLTPVCVCRAARRAGYQVRRRGRRGDAGAYLSIYIYIYKYINEDIYTSPSSSEPRVSGSVPRSAPSGLYRYIDI